MTAYDRKNFELHQFLHQFHGGQATGKFVFMLLFHPKNFYDAAKELEFSRQI